MAHTHTGRTGRRCPPLRGAQPQAADHAHERRGGGDAPQDGRVAGASVVRHAENEWPDGGRRHVGGLQDAWIRVRVRVQFRIRVRVRMSVRDRRVRVVRVRPWSG